MIHVIATITCTPGKREAFLAEFRRIVPLVLQERGCMAYGPTVDCAAALAVPTAARPDVVVVVEQWHDVASLKAHQVASHMLAYRERVKGLVQNVAVQVLDPV
jgi:quinol monooxygenase YgiN